MAKQVKANPKPKLSQVIDEERKKITVRGEFGVSSLVDVTKRRLDGDLSLIGIDTYDAAQSAVRSYLESRRPDWTQPAFDWYADELLIPFDENGNEVELKFATGVHLAGYADIRFAGFQSFMKAQNAFTKHFKWLTTNLKTGETLGQLMKRKIP